MSDPGTTSKRPKGRSPAYPSINLERAIQRVEQIFKRERQYAVSAAVIPALWSYSALNGPAAQQLSALLKFGLLESQGAKDEREVRVSDLAVQILQHPSSEARQDAIQKAALLPPIHQEMWAEYGAHLPSDSNLLWRLTRDRGFTETGAKEFVREWRETMEFAGLLEPVLSTTADVVGVTDEVPVELSGGSAAEVNPPQADAPQSSYQFPAPQAKQIVESLSRAQESDLQDYKIPIALAGRPPVTITGAFPLSEGEWTQFMAILSAMKPVLVGAAMPPAGHPSTAAGEQIARKILARDGADSEVP